jgi:3,4-dihydroxy 2-butanone 4-phosphate synthase/GTP cyclohydrolase II
MKDDGTMARLPDLIEFGKEHGIRVVAVADIIKYRMRTERIVKKVSEGVLEVEGCGTWRTILYRGERKGGLHMALVKGTPSSECLVRVQGAPAPWAFLNSEKVGSAGTAWKAMKAIDEAGQGIVVFMHLGGASMTVLEDSFVKDFTGAVSRRPQAHAEALRDLGTGCQILVDLGVREMQMLSGSDRPIIGIEAYGLRVSERVSLGE